MPPKTNKPTKPKVRRYHWYAAFLFIMGTLFPPLAVAARFGFGKDFWINLLLTICGYIPGHAHNFYIQNIRNNKTHRRTPKWAQRYGLIDTSTIRRHEQRSQWAGRYNDRNPDTTYEGQPLEEGQVEPSRPPTQDSAGNPPGDRNELWKPDDESYYGAKREGSFQTSESGGRWRYPANFTDTIPGPGDANAKKKKKKKDRWARTEDAYTAPEQKKRKKKSKNRSTVGDGADVASTHSYRSESPTERGVQEEAIAERYEGRKEQNGEAVISNVSGQTPISQQEDEFNHEF
ncbi:hypothetical protein PAXINDRAFT_112386 [Paxillus involutus ATCC 200175]|nr:hypothetical protein PAXINDRAFT_112386 [Paxillus involutus ATCC 200175]